ncbi:MAG TPA: glycosyltransferase, partial [Thermoanaerobaculia bacterium]|nr:glycosyltransferase [Thermoanaerobaculia bacterium]
YYPLMPRVSVIIATWNWSAALRLAIRSVLAQTFDDFELLVIGDGCTDDSAAVVAAAKDPRVSWHNLGERGGSQAGPNNEGIRRARGEYVAYHGHDDLWHPRHLGTLVRALDDAQADLAYAGTIFYGPPEADVRGVTGVAPPLRGNTLRFAAPSSIAHRRDLVDRVGGWGNPRELGYPADYEFQRRAWASRQSFVSTGHVTVFKFPAAWRRDAYRTRSVDEQEALLRRMHEEPDFLERELVALAAAFAEHRTVDVARSVEDAPGHLSAITKAFKGAPDEGVPRERVDRLRYAFDVKLAGLEWYRPETHPDFGTFQWSGPSRRSSLDLPLRTDAGLDIAIHILSPLEMAVLDELRFTVNGDAIALEVTAEPTGAFLLRGHVRRETLAQSDAEPRFTFEVPRTIVPSDLDAASGDHRRLGLPFNWMEVGPAPPA